MVLFWSTVNIWTVVITAMTKTHQCSEHAHSEIARSMETQSCRQTMFFIEMKHSQKQQPLRNKLRISGWAPVWDLFWSRSHLHTLFVIQKPQSVSLTGAIWYARFKTCGVASGGRDGTNVEVVDNAGGLLQQIDVFLVNCSKLLISVYFRKPKILWITGKHPFSPLHAAVLFCVAFWAM